MKKDLPALFESLPSDKRQVYAPALQKRSFQKGDILFQEGEPGEYLWFIMEGEVKVFKEYSSGKSAVMGLFGPGGTVAEVPIIDGRSYPATCQSVTAGYALTLPRDKALKFITENPEVAHTVMKGLGAKLRSITSDLGSMAVQTVIRRLSRFLLKLEEKVGRETEEGRRLDLFLTRKDLAECIGTSFEVAVRCLGKLQDEGILDVDGKKIWIRDHARLQKLAQD